MHLLLLRHTSVNVPKGMCYGRTDVGLANTFPAEVKMVLKQLKGENIDYVFSSPLSRCTKLFDALNRVMILPNTSTDDRLMELDFGDWEQRFWKDIELSDYAKRWFEDFVNVPCLNGESYQQLVDRVRYFIRVIDALPNNATVLIITHGGVVRAFHAIINNSEPRSAFDLKVDYGQLIKLSYKND